MEKTAREVIKDTIGISVDAGDITPMDYGECVKCMELYATLHSSQLKEELKQFYYGQIELLEKTISALREENERLRKACKDVIRFKPGLLICIQKDFQYPNNAVNALEELDSALHPSHNTEDNGK
jgi:hypothetical protein